MKKKIIYVISILVIVGIVVVRMSYAANTDTNAITSDKYEIANNTIYAVPTSSEFLASELKENITSTETIQVYSPNDELLCDYDAIGTDYKVKVSNETYNVVLLGDLTEDGNITLGDVSKVYNHYRKKKVITDNTINAGKLTGNSDITIGDVSKLYNFYRGKMPFSYYSSEHPDGILDEVNATVDNLAALKAYNASVGQVIETKGYSTANDGGGAKYLIEEKNGQTADNALYIKLSNGKIAKYIIAKKTINVKAMGAKGDGTTDDHNFFAKAINAGAETIYIPDGTYNLNNSKITLKRFTRLLGTDPSKVTLKEGTFRAQYGINAENITFDGGVTSGVGYIGVAADDSGKIQINATPASGATDVFFKNCTFQNATVASHAISTEESKSIRNNVVIGCKFKNLGRLGIYHNITMGEGKYIENIFDNLGSSDLLEGEVSAIFLGDITNNTSFEVDKIYIYKNKFSNLITADNFDASADQTHIINANFIAVRGYNAVIDNNEFTNLEGYGNDREGVYTKVQNLTVSNNILTDAGMGEGYICAKPHFGDAVFHITNNKFYGKAGNAIKDYGTGTIEGNEIYIENTKRAIECSYSDTRMTSTTPLTIKNNLFQAGTSTNLVYHDHEVENYATDTKVVSVPNSKVEVIFEDNKVQPTTDFSSYVSIMNTQKKVTVKNNKFYLSERSGDSTVTVTNTSKSYADTLDTDVTFEGNYFENGNFKTCARTGLHQTTEQTTSREISFKNNTINQVYPRIIHAIITQTPNNNNDKLIVSGNTTNTTKSNTAISTQTKEFELDNPDFAKVSHKLAD